MSGPYNKISHLLETYLIFKTQKREILKQIKIFIWPTTQKFFFFKKKMKSLKNHIDCTKDPNFPLT